MISSTGVEGESAFTTGSYAVQTACADFLNRFKFSMSFYGLHPVRRTEYLQGLADLGITFNQSKEIINSLTVSDYCSGPEQDHYATTIDVWVFGHELPRRIEAYIKLRLMPIANTDVVQAQPWSFHKAQQPLKYPFRASC